MSIDRSLFGSETEVSYPRFKVSLTLPSVSQLKFDINDGERSRTEIFDTQLLPFGYSQFAVSWQESDSATVTLVQDYDCGLVYSYAILPDGRFMRMPGTADVTQPVFDDRLGRNRSLVLEAMASLFQRHDASAVQRFYAADYIQHNPNIPQGRDALQARAADLSKDIYYDPGLIVAEGDFVAIHGRICGWADTPQHVIDIFRIERGRLAEHWDVLQVEVSVTAAIGQPPMFRSQEESTRCVVFRDTASR